LILTYPILKEVIALVRRGMRWILAGILQQDMRIYPEIAYQFALFLMIGFVAIALFGVS